MGGEQAASAMDTIATSFTSFGNTFKGDVTSMITTVLPIALGVVGLVLAVKFGIKFFKSTVNKAG